MSNYEYKTVPAWYEVVSGEDEGVVKHLISLFGVIDEAGDVAHPGMFTKTISERKSDIAVVDTHRRDTILASIGYPIKLEEVGRAGLSEEVKSKWPEATGGLVATTQFLLNTPEGLGAFQRIKAGAVNQFSYAFKALDFDFEVKSKRRIRNLRTVKMREYGPCLFGLNEGAVVLDVKADTEYEAYKAQSLTSVVEAVRKAFYQQVAQDLSYYLSIREVFEDYVIAAHDTVCYKIPYKLQEDKYLFTELDPSKWVGGKYEFVPNTESEVEEKAELDSPTYEAELLQLQLQLLGLELKAGPL